MKQKSVIEENFGCDEGNINSGCDDLRKKCCDGQIDLTKYEDFSKC